MRFKKTSLGLALGLLASTALASSAFAQETVDTTRLHPKDVTFSFEGPFGTYDRGALQRGFQVYKEVCSACHSAQHLAFHNLAGPGGPEFSGKYYNPYFEGWNISMPPPLTDNAVTYSDGTKATVAQEAHDVVTFLAWASEPKMEERKRMGFGVLIFLIALAGVLFAAYRKVWKDAH